MIPTTVRSPEPAAERRPAVGSKLRLGVHSMALEGDAIARWGNYVVFVPGAIPGEEVEAEVVSVGRKHGRARLIRVLTASPHRVAPPCPHFGACGGCTWQHIAYPEQLKLKERLLASTLELALGDRVAVLPAAGIDPPWQFRDKVHFVVGREAGSKGPKPALGHYAVHSRTFIPVKECRVHSEAGNRLAFKLRDLLAENGVPAAKDDMPGSGVARHILVRTSARTGESQAVLVSTKRDFPALRSIAKAMTEGEDAASGFHLNIHRREGNLILGSFTRRITGHERLEEEVAGVRFRISPSSFFQTSVRAAETLVGLVIGALPSRPDGPVLDLYAGVGFFALPLARRGYRVTAVEENPIAIRDGIESGRRSGIRSCRFVEGRVEEQIRSLSRQESFATVLLDPPREGCSERVLQLVARAVRPQRIVYVSCDPRALVRDLRILRAGGFAVEDVRPVDMFPQTAHIEAVAKLRYLGGGRPSPRFQKRRRP